MRGRAKVSAGNFAGKNIENLNPIKGKMEVAVNEYFNAKIEKNRKTFDNQTLRINNALMDQTITPLIEAIKASIIGEKDSLYPAHTTEQVISAFFCAHFNTQGDIWKLLGELDNTITDKAFIPNVDDYLKQDDLPGIAQHDVYDLDDVFDLAEADIWTALTPYRPGSPLLSNGNTYRFDRAKDTQDRSTNTFADCAEMGLRHVVNLLLYNNEDKAFDLSHIRQIAGNSPYFQAFEAFYQNQTPALANAGDIDMRSLWNTVVGDLNTTDDPTDPYYIVRVHTE
jgi:hypothetical protein